VQTYCEKLTNEQNIAMVAELFDAHIVFSDPAIPTGNRYGIEAVKLLIQDLACLYLAKGDTATYEQAEHLLLQSLAMREHVLETEHPQRKSLHNLALLYEAQGNDTEAAQLYQRALHRKQILERANPKTMATVEDYTRILRRVQNIVFCRQNCELRTLERTMQRYSSS
jgi:hypothetical protein